MILSKQNITGYFALVLAATFIIMAAFSALTALNRVGDQSWAETLKGKWTSSYEGEFDDNLAHYTPSLNFWNKFSFSAFKEGKKGVLIGDDGWLFTTEEFDRPENYNQNIKSNLTYITDIQEQFKSKNIDLFVLPIPAKARVLEKYLGRYKIPEYRANLYQNFLTHLKVRNILHIDILSKIKGDQNFFLKTDTHWTPEGAQYAASQIAADLDLNHMAEYRTNFEMLKTDVIDHEGDLMRYTVKSHQGLDADQLHEYKLRQATNDNSDDLFAETYIPVALIGTSYSANKLWQFENFLKQKLSLDVLNMADEGLGPFATMEKYLKSNSYKNSPPKMVIWEIPERFIPVHYNLNYTE